MNWSDIKGIVAEAAPVLGSLLGGPAGGAVGGVIAKALGVDATADKVAEAMRLNPDAVVKLRQLEMEQQQAISKMVLEHEAVQLSEVNATMRAEYTQEDLYVKRWRPTLGYAVTLTWVMTWGAVVYAIIFKPVDAPAIITALAQSQTMWGVALAVLGVGVVKRSHDKQVQAGQEPTGLLKALLKR
ncbi:MAG: 3TM-type holin [Mariprofundales bacterium]